MAFPTDITLASKIVFSIAEDVSQFNDKTRRMSNQDYDFTEVLSFICNRLDYRELSPDTAAIKFNSERMVKNTVDYNDALILRDAFVVLYTSLQRRIDPWLVVPDVRVIFENYDFKTGDLVINFA